MIDTQEMRRKLGEYRAAGQCWLVVAYMKDDPELVGAGLDGLAQAIYDRGHAYYGTVLALIENLEMYRERTKK